MRASLPEWIEIGPPCESTCAPLFQNYENMSVFERWGALPVLESCGKTAAAKTIALTGGGILIIAGSYCLIAAAEG